MGVDINSDEVVEQITEHFEQIVDQVEGEYDLVDVLDESFMQEHTDFSSLEELFEAGGWDVEQQADFEDIPQAELDSLVAERSDFDTWDEMVKTGFDHYVKEELL
jgi:hypothetical protein